VSRSGGSTSQPPPTVSAPDPRCRSTSTKPLSWYRAGSGIEDVARRFGVSATATRHRLRAAGVEMRPRGPRPAQGHQPIDLFRVEEFGVAEEGIGNGLGYEVAGLVAIELGDSMRAYLGCQDHGPAPGLRPGGSERRRGHARSPPGSMTSPASLPSSHRTRHCHRADEGRLAGRRRAGTLRPSG